MKPKVISAFRKVIRLNTRATSIRTLAIHALPVILTSPHDLTNVAIVDTLTIGVQIGIVLYNRQLFNCLDYHRTGKPVDE